MLVTLSMLHGGMVVSAGAILDEDLPADGARHCGSIFLVPGNSCRSLSAIITDSVTSVPLQFGSDDDPRGYLVWFAELLPGNNNRAYLSAQQRINNDMTMQLPKACPQISYVMCIQTHYTHPIHVVVT